MPVYKSRSPQETARIAKEIAARLLEAGDGAPIVIGLTGDLGAAKTAFAGGFLRALGVRHPVVSPTFVLIKEYGIKKGKYKAAYHADTYRLDSPKEILSLGLRDLFARRGNIILIEWADRIRKELPPKTVWIRFSHGRGATERLIEASF